MKLETADGKHLVSKEEYDFLQLIKQLLPHIRNRLFAIGRDVDTLSKKSENLK